MTYRERSSDQNGCKISTDKGDKGNLHRDIFGIGECFESHGYALLKHNIVSSICIPMNRKID